MIPILISFFWVIIYFFQITIIFQKYHINNRAKVMFYLWLINIPCLLFFSYAVNTYYKLSFSDYYFLIIFYYVSGFFGGVLQLYNLADRGFSLRVLIDILESKHNAMSLEDIKSNYSSGKGLKWMYEKRLMDMSENKLVCLDNNQIENLKNGTKLAVIFIQFRRLINLF